MMICGNDDGDKSVRWDWSTFSLLSWWYVVMMMVIRVWDETDIYACRFISWRLDDENNACGLDVVTAKAVKARTIK